MIHIKDECTDYSRMPLAAVQAEAATLPLCTACRSKHMVCVCDDETGAPRWHVVVVHDAECPLYGLAPYSTTVRVQIT